MSKPPRLFISYSWSTPEHEQWVVDLATELVSSGVNVILDKWDLREGNDSVAFMEKMVTDPSISKVILICDQVYVSKADGRAGGVGTETQIISSEVYSKQDQGKFVAVIAENDPSGKPYLPTYYKSRIYVDLSESDRYSENLEKLLRWIFDKPLYVRPELGKPPSFVLTQDGPVLGTSVLAKRVIEGLKGDKGYVRGAIDEYLTTFGENLEKFRIVGNTKEPHEQIVESIEAFLPSRNEFIQVFIALTQYAADSQTYMPRIQRFFESLIPYLDRPPHLNQWNETDFDNFKFIVHELFLYAIAIALRGEHFESATYLLTQPYYVSTSSERGLSPTSSYAVFKSHLKSLEIRNARIKANRLSLRADILKQRSTSSGVEFRHLLQADFVCFFRAALTGSTRAESWWPETLVYASHQYGPFEMFARATSAAYLKKVMPVLGVSTLDAIKVKLDQYKVDNSLLPSWQFESFSPAVLIGFAQLGVKA
jgi:TIR domain